jgi:glycosyltransferase involved in cell wall biosynthesis
VSRRVVLLRGRSAAPWDLHPYEHLGPGYEVSVLVTRRNLYSLAELRLERRRALALSDIVPAGAPGRLAVHALGERFLRPARHLRAADIVHAAELGNWYSAQAARLKQRLGFRLIVTTWETLPLRNAYRNVRTRPYARRVLAAADRFIASTERARDALLLEGAAPERIRVCAPGVELESFAAAGAGGQGAGGGDTHLVLSAGRLVWEKGHQDLLRALALLRLRGRHDVRALIVGQGPEERVLRALASDLGLEGAVEFRGGVPHHEMPSLYAHASCLVLASLPVRFWEEQFGMVLAEAMAAGLPVIASTSGAIPEVLGGGGDYVAPGDWVGLADALAAGPLSGASGARRSASEERLRELSVQAAGERVRAVYDEVLADQAPQR